jgi:hypothetical protein
MSESRSATTYRVAVKTQVWGTQQDQEGIGPSWIDYRGLRILGDYAASSPKLAVEAAIEEHGTPAEAGANAVAIPVGNWHEFPVGREVKPVYAIGEKLPPQTVTASTPDGGGDGGAPADPPA